MKYYLPIFLLLLSGCSNLSVKDDNITESNIDIDDSLTEERDDMNNKTYTKAPEIFIDSSKSYKALMETSQGDISIQFY